MRSDVPSILAEIVAHKRDEVAAGKAARPRVSVDGLPATRGFAGAIRRTAGVKEDNPGSGATPADR